MRAAAMAFFAVGLSGLMMPSGSYGQAITVQELAAANREAILRIHSLVVAVEEKSNLPTVNQKYTWTWSGENARCQHHFLNRPPAKGEFSRREFPLGYTDACNGPNGYFALVDYDPAQSVDLQEVVDHPASGVIGVRRVPGTKGRVVVDQVCTLALAVPGADGCAMWLSEAVETAAGSHVTTRPDDEGSDGCFVLELERRDTAGRYRIWVSPAHNFMMKAIKSLSDNNALLWERTVNRFTRLEGENYLATALTTRDGEIEIATTVNVISMNVPISNDAFDVVFPRGLIVFDETTGKTVIWGDGGPQLAFATKEEFQNWDRSRKEKYAAANSTGLTRRGITYWWAFAGLQFTLLLAVWVVIRKMRSAKARPE